MIEALIVQLITAFIIVGIWVTMQEGMVFSKIREKVFEPIKSPYLRKPLFECMICMSSIWGVILWFTIWNGSFTWGIIPFIFAVAGILTIISFAIGE